MTDTELLDMIDDSGITLSFPMLNKDGNTVFVTGSGVREMLIALHVAMADEPEPVDPKRMKMN